MMKRKARRLARIIALDHPADREAGIVPRERQRGIEMVAADIVEIDVDAVRRRGGQALEDRPGLIVDDLVGAERADELAFLRVRRPIRSPSCPWPWRSGPRPTRPRPPPPRRTRCRLAFARRRVEQPEIGRRAGDSEHAEELLAARAPRSGSLLRRAPTTTASSRQPAMCWTRSPGAKPSALLSTTSPIAPPSIGSPTWNGGT